jgi:hypothetical protein
MNTYEFTYEFFVCNFFTCIFLLLPMYIDMVGTKNLDVFQHGCSYVLECCREVLSLKTLDVFQHGCSYVLECCREVLSQAWGFGFC